MIEFKNYRVEGHCRVIVDLPIFRPKDVVEKWANHDPIKVYSERLVEKGILTKADVDAIYKEVDAEITEAIEFGKNSPRPDKDAFLSRVKERYAL